MSYYWTYSILILTYEMNYFPLLLFSFAFNKEIESFMFDYTISQRHSGGITILLFHNSNRICYFFLLSFIPTHIHTQFAIKNSKYENMFIHHGMGSWIIEEIDPCWLSLWCDPTFSRSTVFKNPKYIRICPSQKYKH